MSCSKRKRTAECWHWLQPVGHMGGLLAGTSSLLLQWDML